jgi:hypothetical protein
MQQLLHASHVLLNFFFQGYGNGLRALFTCNHSSPSFFRCQIYYPGGYHFPDRRDEEVVLRTFIDISGTFAFDSQSGTVSRFSKYIVRSVWDAPIQLQKFSRFLPFFGKSAVIQVVDS